jgi:hypothetical protein
LRAEGNLVSRVRRALPRRLVGAATRAAGSVRVRLGRGRVTLAISAVLALVLRYSPWWPSDGLNIFVEELSGRVARQLPGWLTAALPWLVPALVPTVFFWAIGSVVSLFGVWFAIGMYRGRPGYGGRRVFAGDARADTECQQDMIKSLRSSPFMYCLLLAGYKLVYEEDRALLDELARLARDHSKDIRLLLFDRDSPNWAEKIRPAVGSDVETFKDLCRCAERRIRAVAPYARISYHTDDTNWRLYIFEDRIFVARYALPPDIGPRPETLGPLVALGRRDPLYNWMRAEFVRRCPREWLQDLQE